MSTKFWSKKNFVIFAFLTFLIIPANILAQEDNQEAKKIFNSALEAQQNGDDSTAILLYGGVIDEDGNFLDAFINRGSIFFKRKIYGNAEIDFKKATEIDPTSTDAWANLGRVYYKQKKYDDALNSYNTVISNNAEYFEIYKDLGLVQFVKKDWAGLVKSMTTYTQHFTNDYLPYYLAGKAQQKLKKYPEAIASYKKSIGLKKDYFNSFNSLGQIYQAQEKFTSAFTNFKKAVQVKPDNYRAIYNMAISFESGNQDDVDNVIKYWNQFLKVARKNPKAKSMIPGIEEHLKDLNDLKEYNKNN
ncbi:MAG: tetratricopeptide repeat protein [candidate division Zixibacteria bacterium]|nr:tetratricopeptide repeat protein [candidate division Zixibacteria bacterium]